MGNGNLRRRYRRKRPGTLGICAVIQHRFGIDAVPHLLCRGFTREETEDAMIEMSYLGVSSVMAIRGDETKYLRYNDDGSSTNKHASDLVAQLADLRSASYIEEVKSPFPIDVCVGVCGYPEKHFEAPNTKLDLNYLKQKCDAGADYIVTQMFFDNSRFIAFVDRCRDAKLTQPIIPGIKVLSSHSQLTRLAARFGITLPDDLVDEVMASPAQAKEIGIRWAVNQCRELLDQGQRLLHFYVFDDVESVIEVVRQL